MFMLALIPIELIASISAPVATALGAYNLGRFFITKARAARQKAKTAKATIRGVKAAVAYAKEVKAKLDAVTPEHKANIRAKIEELLSTATK